MLNGDGMSFAEFTYPLLQAWDWWHMYRDHNVVLQVGGQDQYGNIMAGIDAVRQATNRMSDCQPLPGHSDNHISGPQRVRPMGITVPLLTTSKGEKFGKSAGNAVWLDTELTSAFDMYGVSAAYECSLRTLLIYLVLVVYIGRRR